MNMKQKQKQKLETHGLRILVNIVKEQKDCLYITYFKNMMYIWDGQLLYRRESKLSRTYIGLQHIFALLNNNN